MNVDFSPLVNPDVAHDLNTFPYPFEDNSFDYIEAYHVLEHLDRPFEVMRELHRIARPNARIHIKVPHFSRGFTHAEHAHGFDVSFPLYFNPTFTTSGYFGVSFALEYMRLHWMAFGHLMPHMGYSPFFIRLVSLAGSVLSFFANLSPNFCSRIWCFWVGGFEEIEFMFKCNK